MVLESIDSIGNSLMNMVPFELQFSRIWHPVENPNGKRTFFPPHDWLQPVDASTMADERRNVKHKKRNRNRNFVFIF